MSKQRSPAAPIVQAFLIVLGITLLNSVFSITLIAVAGAGLAMVRCRHSRLIIPRLAALLPVLLLLTIPLLVAEGWPPTADLQLAAALLGLRMLASALVLAGLLAGKSGEELVEGLQRLKMPTVMIQVLLLSFRYFMMVKQDGEKAWRAMKARGLGQLSTFGMLPVTGEWMGGFFLKSMDHSEKVYQAMQARGFGGQVPEEKLSLGMNQVQKGTTALITLGLLVLILLERGV